jgi:hypothetical protein
VFKEHDRSGVVLVATAVTASRMHDEIFVAGSCQAACVSPNVPGVPCCNSSVGRGAASVQQCCCSACAQHSMWKQWPTVGQMADSVQDLFSGQPRMIALQYLHANQCAFTVAF